MNYFVEDFLLGYFDVTLKAIFFSENSLPALDKTLIMASPTPTSILLRYSNKLISVNAALAIIGIINSIQI